jgi:hypothetical protein
MIDDFYIIHLILPGALKRKFEIAVCNIKLNRKNIKFHQQIQVKNYYLSDFNLFKIKFHRYKIVDFVENWNYIIGLVIKIQKHFQEEKIEFKEAECEKK